jgi:hypothetical protein
MKPKPISSLMPTLVEQTESLAGEPSPAPVPTDEPTGLRRLRFNELVRTGDLVLNAQLEFEPWEGPNGFRADSFVRAIYRRKDDDSIGAIRAE